jgi:hypothetical protein
MIDVRQLFLSNTAQMANIGFRFTDDSGNPSGIRAVVPNDHESKFPRRRIGDVAQGLNHRSQILLWLEAPNCDKESSG